MKKNILIFLGFVVSVIIIFIVYSKFFTEKDVPLPPKYYEKSLGSAIVRIQIDGYQPVVGSGGSMSPWIPFSTKENPKSVAAIDINFPFEQLKKGHVVFFKINEETNAIHRLGDKRKEGWITYGIGNKIKDNIPLTRETYIGFVKYVIIINE